MLTTHRCRQCQHGATLVEIAVGLAIVALLAALGLPSLADWIQNTQIRTAAESIQNGLQLARGEAVRRNANVQFVLTAPGTTGGTGWTVSLVSTGEVVQSKPAGEGSRKVVLTATPAGATTITFNGLGRTPTAPPNNADGSAFLTQIDADVPTLASADSRELRILISTGGQIRLCDPNVTSATDPRKC